MVIKLSQDTRPATWQISLPFKGEENILGSYLFNGQNELAIIDPGPTSTADALLKQMSASGFAPQDVTHILLTHIHLDHAGAVGSLLQKMPRATVYVHTKGAPHLIDPTRFIASARRIYGSQMDDLWGEFLPVPEDRIQTIESGDILNIASRRLEVHYTPGHASHHVVFFDVHTGELFAGDIAGVRLQQVSYVRPPTPPPDLDIEAWSTSIDQLKQLRPDVLYLAHYGPVDNPAPHLEHLREKLLSWGRLVLNAMHEKKSEQEIVHQFTTTIEPELLRITGDPQTIRRYDLMSGSKMSVQGYIRYWTKKHPERL